MAVNFFGNLSAYRIPSSYCSTIRCISVNSLNVYFIMYANRWTQQNSEREKRRNNGITINNNNNKEERKTSYFHQNKKITSLKTHNKKTKNILNSFTKFQLQFVEFCRLTTQYFTSQLNILPHFFWQFVIWHIVYR